MGKALKAIGVATAISMASLAAGAASSAPKAPAKGPQCFHTSDWRGWKATPDGRAIYIEAGVKRIWRLDMAQPCQDLNAINAILINRTTQSWICTPQDFNLRVLQRGMGVVRYCQVRKMTRLSADEAKALPKALQP